MPRALWSGSLSFGLVNVPVALVSATRDQNVRFHQLHEPDGARIEIRRFCAQEDREVAYEEIGHGYEVDDDTQVVLTDEELASVAPRRTRTIDIEAFVDLAEVDPIHFDHPYFLIPSGEGEGARRAYALLARVLASTERAALGRFVLRSREHLAILRVRDGRLALTTMLFADEVRPRDDVATGAAKKPAKAQLRDAVALIEELSADWDPGRHEDRYRRRLLDAIERKKAGRKVTAPRAEKEPAAAPDLMAALRRSLEQARAHGPSGDGSAGRRSELRWLSREELYERAQEAEIAGRSKMSKAELVDALAAA